MLEFFLRSNWIFIVNCCVKTVMNVKFFRIVQIEWLWTTKIIKIFLISNIIILVAASEIFITSRVSVVGLWRLVKVAIH